MQASTLYANFPDQPYCATQVTVNLMTAISTQTSRVADPIQTQAILPNGIRGDLITGKIRGVLCEPNANGILTCHLAFSFDSLVHQGQILHSAAVMLVMINSKGQPHVDEEGDFVTKEGWIDTNAPWEFDTSKRKKTQARPPAQYMDLYANAASVSYAPGSQFKVTWMSNSQPMAELLCGTN